MHINTIPMVGVYIYRGTEQIHLGRSEMDDHKALPASETPLLMYPSPTRHKFKEANPDDQQYCYTSHQQQQSLYQHWRPTLSEVVQEIKQLYTTAIPMIITGLLIYGKSMISTLLMGRLGKEALAGGSLSVGIANITGYSIISGLALGMEAISSQAFGAKQWAIMAQTLHQTTAILLLASIPISLLWLNINPILLLCGQDPTISAIASTYLAFSVPDLFFQSFISPLKIYLRTQNITLPLMLSAAFSLAIHAPINYFLVYYLHLGIRGIAMASAIANLNLLISLFLYIQFSGISVTKSWEMSSVTCFNDWKTLLSLAIPSCVSVCLEWWWYELMIVLAGLLPNALEAVAAMGILLQATSLIYIFPSALSLAVSTRVGNELGANQPGKAKTSSLIALSCAILNGFIAMIFLMTMKNGWGGIFTVDSGVLAATAAVMPVAALCEVGNCLQTAGCGVLRGSARPASAANINLGSFYGVGLPVAVVMSLVMDMGLFGLWLGLLAAQVVCAISIVFLLRRTDWVHEANRGRELIGIDEEKQ